MSIPVFDPGITVTLFKLIKRTDGVAKRYAGLRRKIDLTPLLGEGGSVRTSKSVLQPTGAFAISFPDQPDAMAGDTLYALIEPMDVIEIRMARTPSNYASQKLPLIMRGFVSSVSRPEAMGADGAPQRFVVVEGQDAGKLWQIHQIFWPAVYLTDPTFLGFWQINAVLGISPTSYTASQYVTEMVGAMNTKIEPLTALQSAIQPFTVLASVPEGNVLPPQQAALTGDQSYWDILNAFADKPWNELFIQDLEAGPQVVYRPVPYRDINGGFIMPGAADPGSIAVDISQVVSLNLRRTDERVANIFWVDPSNMVLQSAGSMTAAALATGNELDFDYPNNNPVLFGQKIMNSRTNLYPDGPNALGSAPADQSSANDALTGWWNSRNNELKLLNRDNSVFEDGSAMLRGSEELMAGKYLKLTRGSLTATPYITQVDHAFTPFQAWTTSVQLIRGDGFINRNKYAGNAFYAEGRQGVY